MSFKSILKVGQIAVLVSLLAACSGDEGETSLLTKQKLTSDQQAYVDLWSQPNSVAVAHLKEAPVTIDGQTLHPKLQYEYEEDKAKPAEDRYQKFMKIMNDPSARDEIRSVIDVYWDITTKDTRAMKNVVDVQIPGGDGHIIPARIYVPDVGEGKTSALPVVVYYHGGGFIFASIKALDGASRLLAQEAEVIVVSVGYRLSPEAKFPAANHDAITAYNWTIKNIAGYGGDAANIGVGGDSAGGYLSLATIIHQIEKGGQVPSVQLLYYPLTDTEYKKYPSFELFKTGFGLDAGFIQAAFELTIKPEDAIDARLRPVDYAHLDKMPPGVVASAGFDPLRDQARIYAERVNAAGGNVTYLNYPSLTHGFLEASGTIDDAEKAALETAHLIKDLIRKK